MTPERCLRRFRAVWFIRYPVCRTASNTALRVASLTCSGLLNALLTVAVETPATIATSLIFIVLLVICFQFLEIANRALKKG
ncbi:hypothetical protein PsAD2_01940 [Pseudovibrio axinellae]|uniref:Uncharacterized protein n=1 Tax=Pseudovibrio axinellae TaxID=989403 RepID=A0A165Z0G0_9HYPH|nr:hypothetical protein PsAD2_01940 [Pseudovibrio axinellae]